MPEKTKQKILYVITKSNWGGAQRYVYDLATNLPRDRFEVVVAFGGSGALKEKLEGAKVRTVEVNALKRDINLFFDLPVFVGLFNIIRRERPDILHLNSSKVGGLGALVGRILRIRKIIFTAHGWAFKEKRRAVERKLIEYFSWLTILLAHQTIVVSCDDQQKIAHFFYVSRKVTVIRNGIGEITLLGKDDARKKIMGSRLSEIPSDSIWIGSVAELHRNKGIEYAIHAYAEIVNGKSAVPLQNTAFIVVGAGEEEKRLTRLIEKYGLGKKFFLVGNRDNAASLMSAFDIFVISSLKEGLPYALLEAGAAGVATIATNVGGVPEVIKDMESGIVVRAKRPKELEQSLSYLIAKPDERIRFGRELQAKVRTDFSIRSMLEKTLAIY